MGIIEPTNEYVLSLKGLHLYHTARSNCAARVRLLLEEKELAWTNHHIDLGKKENISEEYFGINPKGWFRHLCMTGGSSSNQTISSSTLRRCFLNPGSGPCPTIARRK